MVPQDKKSQSSPYHSTISKSCFEKWLFKYHRALPGLPLCSWSPLQLETFQSRRCNNRWPLHKHNHISRVPTSRIIKMKLKSEEFFGLYNYRVVTKCCRRCKHIREKFYDLDNSNPGSRLVSYYYCAHPEIEQSSERPGPPIDEFDICDAWEKSC